MEALSSCLLSCRLLAAPGAAGGDMSRSRALLCHCSPPDPANPAFSHAAPQVPGTPSPTTAGTRSRMPGKGHAAPPAAPTARQRAGPPRPPPSPHSPARHPRNTQLHGAAPGSRYFFCTGMGGDMQPPPSVLGRAAWGLAGCSPHPPTPVCPRWQSRQLRHPGLFLSACWLPIL